MDDELGLEGIFTEPPSPPPPNPTFAQCDLVEGTGRVSIRLVGSHPLWGHHLWNAARSFASYLETHANGLCQGKTVLELGAGGGLPGIIAARCGARKVLLTDYPDAPLIENLTTNVEANIPPENRKTVAVLGYIWGRSVSELLANTGIKEGSGFDVILMSDLIFNHSQHDALLDTAESCIAKAHEPSFNSSRPETPCVLVFYTHHRPHLAERDLGFFAKASARGWICKEILTETFEPMFPENGGDERIRSEVHGWQMKLASPVRY